MTQQDPRVSFSHQTTSSYFPAQQDQTHETYEELYYPPPTATCMNPAPFVRVVKRRTTANKKERRRTQSINSAFAYLRDCIPNVPSDTKLSKVSEPLSFQREMPNFVRFRADKDAAIGHLVHKLFEWRAGRRPGPVEWLPSRAGAVLEEDQRRATSQNGGASKCTATADSRIAIQLTRPRSVTS